MPTAWWVNQGTTYAQEREGGYVWAPTTNKAGHPLEHHTNVNRLEPGDTIIHYANGAIRAVSTVRERATKTTRPVELPSAPWENEGYHAKVDYRDLALQSAWPKCQSALPTPDLSIMSDALIRATSIP
jgi:5-methylcytosine-specific restriction enzyme B